MELVLLVIATNTTAVQTFGGDKYTSIIECKFRKSYATMNLRKRHGDTVKYFGYVRLGDKLL
jgi:hypothetical protein